MGRVMDEIGADESTIESSFNVKLSCEEGTARVNSKRHGSLAYGT